MTAVVLIHDQNGLAMISDLMLTSEEQVKADIFAPTVNRKGKGTAGKKFIAGLCQKIIRINDNVTVGFSCADMKDAKQFLLYLNRHLQSTTPDFRSLESILNRFREYYPKRLANLQYIAVHSISAPNDLMDIKIFHHRATMGPIGPFQRTYAIGSGGSELIKQISLLTTAALDQFSHLVIEGDVSPHPFLYVPLIIVAQGLCSTRVGNGLSA